ncbi:MAG: GtrA family protein [Muribaculaceae bacterium]|nr:GtrA family protein [Muribaculaceae bacterium]
MKVDRSTVQFVKYCMVGALNTLVTLCTIFVCKSLFDVNEYLSNAIGYVLGVINSFLWNKQWVFHSHGGYRREALKFIIGFLLCYGLQLAAVASLNSSSFGDIEFTLGQIVISGYGISTVIGCGVYTVCNYAYNRLITFR